MEKPIRFNEIPWDTSNKGVTQKVFSENNITIRLVRFNDEFIEKNWCTINHVGYILKGKLRLEFTDRIETYKKGDALILKLGKEHKINMLKGMNVEMILFEE
jgi:mannose-6-phosphate isomerase-like protein (cupin superfamily)